MRTAVHCRPDNVGTRRGCGGTARHWRTRSIPGQQRAERRNPRPWDVGDRWGRMELFDFWGWPNRRAFGAKAWLGRRGVGSIMTAPCTGRGSVSPAS
eukprot:2821253-Alexandrium_andersonii.AAC.1